MKKVKRVQARRRVQVPSVYQIEASECGAACLSMILQYHGCTVPMEEIRYECGVSRDGCSAADIVRAAGKFGMKAKGYRQTLDGLRQISVPCILHWNFMHFVVLEGVGKNALTSMILQRAGEKSAGRNWTTPLPVSYSSLNRHRILKSASSLLRCVS